MSAQTFCTIYDEVIVSELYEAEDCPTYEVCAEGDQPVDPDLDARLAEVLGLDMDEES